MGKRQLEEGSTSKEISRWGKVGHVNAGHINKLNEGGRYKEQKQGLYRRDGPRIRFRRRDASPKALWR